MRNDRAGHSFANEVQKSRRMATVAIIPIYPSIKACCLSTYFIIVFSLASISSHPLLHVVERERMEDATPTLFGRQETGNLDRASYVHLYTNALYCRFNLQE